MALVDSGSSSLTNNILTPTAPTKPAPYRIPARRTVNKENVKPPLITHKSGNISKEYVNYPAFADALARARRVKEYAKLNKDAPTKQLAHLTVKNRLVSSPMTRESSNKQTQECLVSNPKIRESKKDTENHFVSNPTKIREIEECFAGFMFVKSPDPSTLPLPTSLLIKKIAQPIMV